MMNVAALQVLKQAKAVVAGLVNSQRCAMRFLRPVPWPDLQNG
jgi:hypothetical protein